MIHVYLDDFRACPKGFVLARNAEECKLLIDSEPIGILSLDFDLGWGQPTGLEVARYIVETGKYPQHVYMHSSSTHGKMQMYAMLSETAPLDMGLSNHMMPDSLLLQIAQNAADSHS
ncbi:cyclic-phosphate processing receiver domain-containing protein [Paenibacillus protaetiae]|uniref:Cell division protein FtsJ n=1 Tax=Paenibacillus protaetiae TaxID=2509456 RepID=A0A4P6ESE9_9BACL|nr:cyclic-phosphate processing receiver domain-containing protein [Paenibacillus protaetiae]QAY66040.1 cell division protein FtsJ [Paenibacillus protaetiae]